MKNKRRLNFKLIASFVLLAFAGQTLLFYAPAYAELACWNDGTKAPVEGGNPLPPNAPEGDANPPGSEQIGDPVNLATGNFAYQHVDFIIPSRALPLEFKRYYNNQGEYEGPFGVGWDHNYNIFLVESVDQGTTYLIRHNPHGSKDKFTKNSNGTYTAPAGVFDTLTKDAQGYVITTKHGVVYRFNAASYLASIADRNANQINFTYNAAGLLVKITDSVDRNITLTYTPENKIASIADFSGRIWKYTYQNSDLTAVITPATQDLTSGTTTAYAYDNHNLTSITDPKGNTYLNISYDDYDRVDEMYNGSNRYSFSYPYFGISKPPKDQQYVECRRYRETNTTTMYKPNHNYIDYQLNDDGTVKKKTEEQGGLDFKTIYEYNSDKLVTRITYPKGNSVLYEYDNLGNLLKITRKPGPVSAEPDIISTFTYEPKFNFIKDTVDPLGRTTSYAYDVKGNLTRITYPQVSGQSPQVNFTYNTYGQPLSVTGPNGNVTTYEYAPGTGYLTKLTQAAGVLNLTTEMSYDPVGNLKTLKDPKGNSTSFEYDSHNNVITTTSTAPFNYITRYKYDANNNLIQLDRQTQESANPWQSTYYTYDSMDRLETVKDSAGSTTVYTYDRNGNRASVTDALYNRTTYEYDRRDMLSKTADAQGNITEYDYDENANLKAIIDAKRNITAYTYDGFDRLTKTTYADGSSEEYTYDANSNLTAKKDAKGQVIYYDYDALNRISEKGLSPKGTVPASVITYAYDLGSRLKEVTDANGKIAYAYDAADRITQVTYPGSKTVAYAYDANSNRTKLIYPDASHITYDYDVLNRLTAIKDQAGANVASYQYDALSRRKQLNYANNTGATYEYDTINRLTKIKGLSPQGTVPDFSYTYDKVGNRLSMADTAGTHNYTYDNIYQLKTVDYPAGSSFTDKAYTYDAAGNRVSAANGSTTNYTSNNLNQYTQAGNNSYTYDANGNLTSDGTNTYTYDHENRLSEGTVPERGLSLSYKYDSFGRRIQKGLSPQGTVPEITTYVYDGDQIIAEYDTTGTLQTKYIYGPGIDEPVAKIGTVPEGGLSLFFYHFDGLGSVTSLTNSTGSTVESYTYDAFGKPLIKNSSGATLTTSSIGNRYMFTGREYDAETALYFYRARYYSPELGRFLQRDPIGYWADFNLYRYCSNNVVNFKDPKGLDKQGNTENFPEDYLSLNIPPEPPNPGQGFKPTPPLDPSPKDPVSKNPAPKWPGYIDINISGGFWLGFTLGFLISNNGVHFYLGGGLVTPGVSASVTYSPSNVTPGWQVGISGVYGAAGQVGYSFGDGGGEFWEAGVGWPPGISATAYYVF